MLIGMVPCMSFLSPLDQTREALEIRDVSSQSFIYFRTLAVTPVNTRRYQLEGPLAGSFC